MSLTGHHTPREGRRLAVITVKDNNSSLCREKSFADSKSNDAASSSDSSTGQNISQKILNTWRRRRKRRDSATGGTSNVSSGPTVVHVGSTVDRKRARRFRLIDWRPSSRQEQQQRVNDADDDLNHPKYRTVLNINDDRNGIGSDSLSVHPEDSSHPMAGNCRSVISISVGDLSSFYNSRNNPSLLCTASTLPQISRPSATDVDLLSRQPSIQGSSSQADMTQSDNCSAGTSSDRIVNNAIISPYSQQSNCSQQPCHSGNIEMASLPPEQQQKQVAASSTGSTPPECIAPIVTFGSNPVPVVTSSSLPAVTVIDDNISDELHPTTGDRQYLSSLPEEDEPNVQTDDGVVESTGNGQHHAESGWCNNSDRNPLVERKGVGAVLITVSGLAWRLTFLDPSQPHSCCSIFGNGRLARRRRRSSSVDRHTTNLNPFYFMRRRDAICYATSPIPNPGPVIPPELVWRPPPPSYHASMQEQALRNFLENQAITLQNRRPGSPPPTYRSHLTPDPSLSVAQLTSMIQRTDGSSGVAIERQNLEPDVNHNLDDHQQNQSRDQRISQLSSQAMSLVESSTQERPVSTDPSFSQSHSPREDPDPDGGPQNLNASHISVIDCSNSSPLGFRVHTHTESPSNVTATTTANQIPSQNRVAEPPPPYRTIGPSLGGSLRPPPGISIPPGLRPNRFPIPPPVGMMPMRFPPPNLHLRIPRPHPVPLGNPHIIGPMRIPMPRIPNEGRSSYV